MSKKKTIAIADIVERANKVFRESEDSYTQGRRYTQAFVENILIDTGNYNGFNYLAKREVEPGKTYGIAWDDNRPVFYDQTRIKFY
jgi:hypothetical protein